MARNLVSPGRPEAVVDKYRAYIEMRSWIEAVFEYYGGAVGILPAGEHRTAVCDAGCLLSIDDGIAREDYWAG